MEDTGKLTTLGRYRLVRRVGRGGMGEVWLAEDPHLLRQVALKVLPLRKRDDEEFLHRFEREAQAAAALHHPHILPVHDYGQQQMPDDQAITYLVMSYVSGGSVDDRLKAFSNGQGALTQDEALNYLFQVAEAIDYAHTHQIIHRDIKPANMLLRDGNWLLLTDFGIARILTDADSFATGTYLGTPTYMAPEQAQGHAVPASDIYSLAIVAYQLFTGRVPFQADNPFALTFQHAFTPPASPRTYNPALSPEFETALLRGLEKDPAQRPRSASAYVTSLDQALRSFPSHLPSPVRTPDGTPVTPPPDRTRRRVLLGAGIGAGVLLLGGGAATYAATVLLRRNPAQATPTVVARPTATTNLNAPLAITAALTKPVGLMNWSPVKNILAASSQDGQIVVWDFTSASQSAPPSELGRLHMNLTLESFVPCWSPDGTMLAVANAGFDLKSPSYETLIYASDLSKTMPVFSNKTEESVQGLGWTAQNYLVAISDTKTATSTQLTLWDMSKPKQKVLSSTISTQLSISDTDTNCAAVSPDGLLLAFGASEGLVVGRLNTTGKGSFWQQIGSLLSLTNVIEMSSVAWSLDGQYVAAISSNNTDNAVVGVWDATKQYQEALPSLAASSVPAQVTAIAWAPASAGKSLLALGGSDGRVYLWNVGSSPEPTRILSAGSQNSITALAWSADGHWLATGYNDNLTTILIWKV
jgi:serine/threonine protein kinase